ncbi:hypothetical protein BJV82DRAFT_330604 [Fennellomyces sp. T-0311]|nr:hypothetical protein BJV82DRAFT_330604 [Fennellomyces sp. T-0311]
MQSPAFFFLRSHYSIFPSLSFSTRARKSTNNKTSPAMSTVAMARMTVANADNTPPTIQDDSSVTPSTSSLAGQTANIPEKDPENNNGITRKSDSGVYFAMMLSEYLDRNANEEANPLPAIQESSGSDDVGAGKSNDTGLAATTQPPVVLPEAAAAADDEAMGDLSNLIWVPAHKHPQIAPSEFVNWIQVHGAAPTRKGSKVKRQKSQLSRSMSYNDDASTESDSDSPVSPRDTVRSASGDGKNEHTFDRHSAVIDDSRTLTPPAQNRSLLRRSAFSARRAPGEGGLADRRRSRRPAPVPRHSTDTSERMGFVPSAEPIHLHDTPVSMSEWIDLGSASLEPSEHGILSRVHDAESQLFSKIMDKDPEKPATDQGKPLEERVQVQENDAATTDSDTAVSTDSLTDERRVTLRRSASDLAISAKVDRKPSWISSLLNGDKKRKKSLRGSLRRVDDARHISEKEKETLQLTRVNSMNTPINAKKRGLAAFISRSLSLKSISRKEPKLVQERKKAMTAGTPQQDGVNGPTTVTKHYINSYRLPIHIERALYRLSHMKLASQRRPLHQQVVISNFMFWYLSIINPQPMNAQQAEGQHQNSGNTPWPQHHQAEANEAAAIKSRPRPPKFSATGGRRFSDDSIGARRNSQSSSDEEDNVPLSHYRK